MENILSYIFPPKCLLCDSVGSVLCNDCLESARFIRKSYMLNSRCSVFCLFEYSGCVRKSIRYSKYASKMFSVLRFITMWGVSFGEFFDYTGYVVVPIPLAQKRYSKRGFNQSQVIAEVLVEKFDMTLKNKILIRSKETSPQYYLGREDRFRNMKGAFKVRGDVKGKSILLVDDICTSGSTFVSASESLYVAGAKRVDCFALSKKL